MSHPALAGHFPGHPIVPGVVILDRVVQALNEFLPLPVRITAFPQIKFIAPLAPSQTFFIDFQRKGEGLAAFTVSTAGGAIVTGTVNYAYLD